MKDVKELKFPISAPLLLLMLTAVMAPILGGYIATDSTNLPHDFGQILRIAFTDSDAPVLSHAIIGIPALLALFAALASHRVQQVPKQLLSILWIVFFLFLGVSSVFSTMRGLSILVWLEWLCYGCTMFAAIAVGGRRFGPLLLMGSLSLGAVYVALNGILEYGQKRATDPAWRIFAGWMNPNATAAILLLGMFCALGICLNAKRGLSLVGGIGACLMVVATVLTGSKGSVSLALPIGILAFGAFQCRTPKLGPALFAVAVLLSGVIGILFVKNIGWVGLGISATYTGLVLLVINKDPISTGRVAGIVAAAAAFLFLLSVTTPAPKAATAPAATPMSRVSEGSQTQEQSSEFRLNLWKSAGHLIKTRPLQGYGLGSYRDESARAGLTTATIFAHNVYLQLWAEAGLVPLLCFVIALGVWFFVVTRGRNHLPQAQFALLSGSFAAIVALLVHSLVDSDLYYFGIGVGFFLVLGISLNLAADAVAPELIQKPIRIASLFACCGIGLLMLVFSLEDIQKAIVRQDIATNDSQDLKEDADSLGWAASFDGEARYLQAITSPREQAADNLKEAFAIMPTPRVARMLATVLSSAGKFSESIDVLKKALEVDPNNLRTLSLLTKIQIQKEDSQGALDTAKKMIATESTPYFLVRSIPQDVPTETYDARLTLLAPNAASPGERAKVLSEAVDGYDQYAHLSVPVIKRNEASPQPMPGFDTADEAKAKLQRAIDGGQEAIAIYRKMGGGDAAKLEGEVKDLRDALASL